MLLAFACVGAAATGLYFVLPAASVAQELVYLGFSVAAFVLIVSRAVRTTGRARAGWLCFSVGLLCFVSGDAVGTVYRLILSRDAPFPSVADVLYLAGYPFLILGVLFVFVGARRRSLGTILEGGIVTSAAGLVVWLMLVEPLGSQNGVPMLERLTGAAYPTMDFLLLAALSQVLFRRTAHSRAATLVAAALALQLVADLIYTRLTLGNLYSAGSWVDAGWLLSYLFWGIAAMSRESAEPSTGARSRPGLPWVPLGLMFLGLLTAPLTLMYEALHYQRLETEAVIPVWVLISFLVFARVVLLLQESARSNLAATAAEEAEAATESKHRSLIEHLPLVTYALAAEKAVPAYVSPQIETMLGYPLEAWLSDAGLFERVVHPDDLDLIKSRIASIRSGKIDRFNCEYRVRAEDGREVFVLDEIVTVRDSDGAALVHQGFLLDISERKKLETGLQQAQKMEAVGLLAGGIAHDFNNLLMGIGAYAELLLKTLTPGDPRHEHATQIARATEKATELTRSLLAFGRRQVLQPRCVDLRGVLEQLAPMLERLIGEDVALHTDLGAASAYVYADPTQIEQVVMNLAVNARHAMAAGGTLTLSLEIDAESVVVAVSDTGHGMDEETRRRAFEPFFTTKETGQGTGLGLAMAHGIVEQSGGTITIDSAAGKGTRIEITLPLTDAPVVQNATQADVAVVSGAAANVLLVEDNDAVRAAITELLEEYGHKVSSADGASDAIEVCENQPDFDVLLTDVVMPSMSGPQLAELARMIQPNLKVIFMSGYPSDSIVQRGGFPAGQHFIQKPFTGAELAQTLQLALLSEEQPRLDRPAQAGSVRLSRSRG